MTTGWAYIDYPGTTTRGDGAYFPCQKKRARTDSRRESPVALLTIRVYTSLRLVKLIRLPDPRLQAHTQCNLGRWIRFGWACQPASWRRYRRTTLSSCRNCRCPRRIGGLSSRRFRSLSSRPGSRCSAQPACPRPRRLRARGDPSSGGPRPAPRRSRLGLCRRRRRRLYRCSPYRPGP